MKNYGKETIGPSGKHNPDKEVKPGYSWWIENGVYYQAPTVDPKLFGGHSYDEGGYQLGINECSCGASMYSSSSSGPVDPFGACPENPNPFAKKPITGFWRSACGENHGLNSMRGDEWVTEDAINDTDRLRFFIDKYADEIYEIPVDFHEACAWIDTYIIPSLAGSNGLGQT